MAPQRPTALCAPDSFKGTLAAAEVAAALARGFAGAGWDAVQCPLADGGAGTAAALLAARGGRWLEADAHDALGRPLRARFALLAEGTAALDAAEASGLALLAPGERDPERTSTAGAGELIAAAARAAERVLVGVGDTATCDGGAGALGAIERAGGLGASELLGLCDVRTPWELAARRFAPQKGADEAMVARLERRLDVLAGELPRDPRGVERTGAGGGLAGGLWAAFGAELRDGAAAVCDAAGFDELAARADVIVTGEGRLDETTREGKVVAEVGRRAGAAGIPVHAVVGADSSDAPMREALGLASVRQAGTPEELEAAAIELASRAAS